ncbi:MAG: cupin domain-containing protein [Angustibacter sp.]
MSSQRPRVQAWKIVVPASQTTVRPRTHDGFEWLYVLAGRLRLVLGERMEVRADSGDAPTRPHHPHLE